MTEPRRSTQCYLDSFDGRPFGRRKADALRVRKAGPPQPTVATIGVDVRRTPEHTSAGEVRSLATYRLRIDLQGRPQVPESEFTSLESAKQGFEAFGAMAHARGVIKEIDAERIVRTVCVGRWRNGAVVWQEESRA